MAASKPPEEPILPMPSSQGDISAMAGPALSMKPINLLVTDFQTYNEPVPSGDFLFQLVGYWIEQGRRLDATHGMTIRVLHNGLKLFEFPNDGKIYRAQAGWEVQVVRSGGLPPIDNHYPDQLRLVWRAPPV